MTAGHGVAYSRAGRRFRSSYNRLLSNEAKREAEGCMEKSFVFSAALMLLV